METREPLQIHGWDLAEGDAIEVVTGQKFMLPFGSDYVVGIKPLARTLFPRTDVLITKGGIVNLVNGEVAGLNKTIRVNTSNAVMNIAGESGGFEISLDTPSEIYRPASSRQEGDNTRLDKQKRVVTALTHVIDIGNLSPKQIIIVSDDYKLLARITRHSTPGGLGNSYVMVQTTNGPQALLTEQTGTPGHPIAETFLVTQRRQYLNSSNTFKEHKAVVVVVGNQLYIAAPRSVVYARFDPIVESEISEARGLFNRLREERDQKIKASQVTPEEKFTTRLFNVILGLHKKQKKLAGLLEKDQLDQLLKTIESLTSDLQQRSPLLYEKLLAQLEKEKVPVTWENLQQVHPLEAQWKEEDITHRSHVYMVNENNSRYVRIVMRDGDVLSSAEYSEEAYVTVYRAIVDIAPSLPKAKKVYRLLAPKFHRDNSQQSEEYMRLLNTLYAKHLIQAIVKAHGLSKDS